MNKLNQEQLDKIIGLILTGNYNYATKVAMHYLGTISAEQTRQVMADEYNIFIKKVWNTEI